MRNLVITLSLASLAGCSGAPLPPEPAAVLPTPSPTQRFENGNLIGLTANELVARFGRPALQIREGNSVKFQFRGGACVLDAYLYPGVGNQYRVVQVDARSPSGTDASQSMCIDALTPSS